MNATGPMLRTPTRRFAATFTLELEMQSWMAATLVVILLAPPLAAQAPPTPLISAPTLSDDAQPPSSPWSPPASLVTPSASDDISMPTIAAEAAGELPFAEADALLDDESVSEVEPAWYRATYWFGPSPWDSGIELGLNGSTGTNESFSLRTGGYVKRKSKYSKLDFSLYHNRTASAGLITQNNAKMDFRNDWMLGDGSPWTLFAKGTLFYDGFQAYDLQTNANTGIGYQFFNLAELELTGRVGGGASREFGGPDNEWLPEGLFGFEYEQRLTATQKLACKLDYHPEIEQFSHYRLVTEASWEISLDKPSNISLKLSATDRYDTTPNGTDPHLVNYSVLLLLKL